MYPSPSHLFTLFAFAASTLAVPTSVYFPGRFVPELCKSGLHPRLPLCPAKLSSGNLLVTSKDGYFDFPYGLQDKKCSLRFIGGTKGTPEGRFYDVRNDSDETIATFTTGHISGQEILNGKVEVAFVDGPGWKPKEEGEREWFWCPRGGDLKLKIVGKTGSEEKITIEGHSGLGIEVKGEKSDW